MRSPHVIEQSHRFSAMRYKKTRYTLRCSPMPSPTNPLNGLLKDPKYAPVVELMNKLKAKEAQKNKSPENRTAMRAKNGESFKFTE